MGGSRSILGNHSSVSFLLIAASIIAVAAIIMALPMAADDSDAVDTFIVGDYQYDVISTANLQVKVSAAPDTVITDVSISPSVVYNNVPYKVMEIAEGGFRNMTSVQSAYFPEGLEVINAYAFYGCTNLTTVTLPYTLTKILDYSFSGCSSLTSIWIHENVSTIETQAFFNCETLSKITVDLANDHYSAEDNVLYNKAKTRLITYPMGKTNESYSMPNAVVTAENNSMYHAKFKNIVLSNNLTSLGDSALEGSKIVKLSLPESLASIGNCALIECSDLESISVNESNTHFFSSDGVLFNSAGTDIVIYPAGAKAEYYTVPITVSTIKDYAFHDNTYLKEVYFTSTLSTIGTEAFYGCSSIQRVEMPESVRTVGSGALSGCTSLKSAILSSSMASLESSLFCNCRSLEVMYITSNITSIKSDAFYGCTGLQSVYIPDTIITMDTTAFRGFTFYARNAITVITEMKDIIGYTYSGSSSDMIQQIGTYSLIHYNEAGGSVIVDDEMVKHSTVYTFPKYSGTLQGFKFSGWLYGDTVYLPGQTAMSPSTNTVITAVWEEYIEEKAEDKITPDVVLGIAIACVAIICALAAGHFTFKYFRKRKILEDEGELRRRF